MLNDLSTQMLPSQGGNEMAPSSILTAYASVLLSICLHGLHVALLSLQSDNQPPIQVNMPSTSVSLERVFMVFHPHWCQLT